MLINEAIKHMRRLTDNGIPFSFHYISCNESTNSSKGLTIVDSALLRPNRKTDSNTLVAYVDLTTDLPRFCHLPLITKFNDKLVINEY